MKPATNNFQETNLANRHMFLHTVRVSPLFEGAENKNKLSVREVSKDAKVSKE
jgi:hypothetical protein